MKKAVTGSHVVKHKRIHKALNVYKCLNHGKKISATALSQSQDRNPEETKLPWS